MINELTQHSEFQFKINELTLPVRKSTPLFQI